MDCGGPPCATPRLNLPFGPVADPLGVKLARHGSCLCWQWHRVGSLGAKNKKQVLVSRSMFAPDTCCSHVLSLGWVVRTLNPQLFKRSFYLGVNYWELKIDLRAKLE